MVSQILLYRSNIEELELIGYKHLPPVKFSTFNGLKKLKISGPCNVLQQVLQCITSDNLAILSLSLSCPTPEIYTCISYFANFSYHSHHETYFPKWSFMDGKKKFSELADFADNELMARIWRKLDYEY
ncbi:uncharacterized protein RJT21DRAFT_111501 [Scheffersomyces amazonensis]|uniref:uncharacterized protein n=1 Tax=Scheffersomyces amazonensis TaxID=1078765 RepID=UPI00315C7A2B